MSNTIILTDSGSDLPLEEIISKQIDYVDFSVYFNGKEIKPRLDWSGMSQEDLYDGLRNGEKLYTLPATEYEIKTKLETYLKKAYDIIFITISKAQSKTYEKAIKVVEDLKNLYKDRKITVIDSKNASIGEGIVVLKAFEYLKMNYSYEEIVENVNKIKVKVLEYVTVPTLTYLSRANRVKSRTAMLGNLLRIKPILTSDENGVQTSIKKVMGLEKACKEVVTMFMNEADVFEDIYVVHGDDKLALEYMLNLLKAYDIKEERIKPLCLGAVVGITSGPGTVGLFGLKK